MKSDHPIAWLIDERWEKAYPLGTICSIGRGAQSTIILRDAAVSRTHAEVKREGDVFVLHPYGASGTKVNGIAVTAPTPLHERDVVEIAFSTLRFTTNLPSGDAYVLSRDTPTNVDAAEVPTRATLHPAERRRRDSAWIRFRDWLTRGPKTD